MPLIVWSDALTVGITSIDADHQSLVGMLNEVYDRLESGCGPDVLDEILRRLIEYTEMHFAREEALLSEHGFPGLKEHQAAHGELRSRVEAFQAVVRRGEPGTDEDVARFLTGWLTRHILSQDHAYAPYLLDRGVR